MHKRPESLQHVARRFMAWQYRLCRAFDRRFLSRRDTLDRDADFRSRLLPSLLSPGAIVYDVGGGRRPAIQLAEKQMLKLEVHGIDLDLNELCSAPAGAYDRVLCADIARLRIEAAADLVLCCSTLEHVRHVNAALQSIRRLLKPGGLALIIVPCRNAAFARLNLLLPQAVKLAALNAIWPQNRRSQGFPAYYHLCTPSKMARAAEAAGLEVRALHPYFHSEYFDFLFPLHVIWLAWAWVARRALGNDAAESFSIILGKPGVNTPGHEFPSAQIVVTAASYKTHS